MARISLLSTVIATVYGFGFFENQAGIIFLVFVLLFFFYRIIRAVVYYRILLVAMTIL
ncbi:MAG: hypothetical protein IPG24_12590 [Leptospiraceae bacterium]|nr:hypothetical protein [Leptospiraceae bacterium]